MGPYITGDPPYFASPTLPQDRTITHLPQKYDALRRVPGYKDLIVERFKRLLCQKSEGFGEVSVCGFRRCSLNPKP